MHYIKDVSAPPTAHNLHFYQLKKRKADPLGTAWLGICPKGVEIYEVRIGELWTMTSLLIRSPVIVLLHVFNVGAK